MSTESANINQARQALAIKRMLDARRRMLPAEWYEPHHTVARNPIDPALASYGRMGKPSGQLQFHQAPHAIRYIATGNGWGGTSALACEIDAWARHTNRWQVTPSWPIRAVWFAADYKQFDIVRKNLEDMAFGKLPKLGRTEFGILRYVWPSGSELYLTSYNLPWDHLEGIEIDLCAFDEPPPEALWQTLMFRRRGKRKTRFIGKATQIHGWTWMAEKLYQPWLKHHTDMGLSEDEAMEVQAHADTWLWPRGGCHDNPALDQADIEWYETRPANGHKQRVVRLFGGFHQFAGDGLFDEEGLDALRCRIDSGETGSLFLLDPNEEVDAHEAQQVERLRHQQRPLPRIAVIEEGGPLDDGE